MDFQKEREAFEKHASKFFKTNEAFEDDGENYVYDEVKFMWDCWLAAKAQAVPEGFVLVEKKEFEQMQEFEDLYRRAIFNSKKSIHEVNWSHVSNLGVGSTRAKAMCKRFNIDPEATFRKPQEPAND
ncbi:hypothetical protein [Acinetobacter johnsonii]|uniref:hypothetical protein n=1 Tax=Acinetobacter johnsonii TaxID=40214 RepID=UPI002448584F|nr:hypothetical protein [Acinetobacter johnsonii]MDH0712004.1 hypothetical protein [Acinetobacter johnsonii]